MTDKIVTEERVVIEETVLTRPRRWARKTVVTSRARKQERQYV